MYDAWNWEWSKLVWIWFEARTYKRAGGQVTTPQFPPSSKQIIKYQNSKFQITDCNPRCLFTLNKNWAELSRHGACWKSCWSTASREIDTKIKLKIGKNQENIPNLFVFHYFYFLRFFSCFFFWLLLRFCYSKFCLQKNDGKVRAMLPRGDQIHSLLAVTFDNNDDEMETWLTQKKKQEWQDEPDFFFRFSIFCWFVFLTVTLLDFVVVACFNAGRPVVTVKRHN